MPAGNPDPASPSAGSMRWYACLYTPAPARALMGTAFALQSELRRIADTSLDHGVAHLKLQWWREEIQRLELGQARHPLTQAAQAAAGAGPGWQPMQDLLSSLELDLACSTYDSEAELDRYLALATGLERALALLLAPADERAARFASAASRCMRSVEIIRDLRQDAMNGRIYLPIAWLDAEGIDHVALRAERPGSSVVRCLARLAEQAREWGRSARVALAGDEIAAIRGMKVLLQLHLTLLDRVERGRFEVGRRQHVLGPMQSLWTSWRAARQH